MSYQQQPSTGEAQSTGHPGHESPSAGEGSGNNHNNNNNGGNNNMAPGFGGQQQQQGGQGMTGSGESQNGGESEKTTLWMGELEPWIDEGFVRQVWFNLGEQVSVKMIRDKFSGNAGYCFVDFESTAAATKAISLNGTLIPNTSRPFKLNWASGGGLSDRKDERGPEYSIFVGDLGPEVNEYILVSLFQSRFPSCKSAKIMTDPMSGLSRGYGFVRFADEMDQQRALTEMQGVYCGNRPMRISTATPKNKPGQMMQPMMQGGHPGQQQQQGGQPQHMGMMQMGMPQPFYAGVPQPMNQFTDPNNTTVFVGGLSGYVTEDELRSFFQGFGEITYVKIPPGKGCGFVQFVQRLAAEMAINQMQGYPIGNSRVRLSWGRSQMNSGPAGTPYRPAPPQQMYPSMGMPPQHAYSPFAPMNPHAQPHVGYGGMHPAGLAPQQQQMQQQQQGGPGGQPGMQMGGPPGQPGAMPTQDPMEPANTQKMNEYYQGGQQDRMQRMDNDARGFGGIYAS